MVDRSFAGWLAGYGLDFLGHWLGFRGFGRLGKQVFGAVQHFIKIESLGGRFRFGEVRNQLRISRESREMPVASSKDAAL